jgi:prepilin-type processing-associated H-X9-DG protein
MRRAIQVLIVVVILLLCSGILTMSVVAVREVAARSECTNNLKQLALAIENYHDSFNTFPTATEENPGLPTEQRLSWIIHIYPYVEANDIYWRMNHKKGWDSEENRFAAQFHPVILYCPAYLSPQLAGSSTPTCYVGITGIGTEAIHLPLEDSRAGFFGYERSLKREDLNKRADSILMLAETSQVHGAWTAAGSPTTRGLIPDGSPYIGVGGQFGGNHRRGANVAFADGSVRFIEQSIDPAVWEAMATLSGKGNQE